MDAVVADHLDVGRDADAQCFQTFLDLVAQAVGVAEDAVVVERAAVGVGSKKGVERLKTRLVQQEQRLEGSACLPAGSFKPHAAFVGLSRHPRPLPQEQQPVTPQLQQFAGGQLAAAEVVRGHTGHFGFEMPVDADKRQVGVYVQVGIVGQGNDPVHLVLAHQIDTALLRLAVIVCDGNDRAVAPLHQRADDGVGQAAKKGMAQGGPDQRSGIRFVGFEPPGIIVDPVAQLVGGLQYADAVFLPDRDIVEHLGNGAQSDTGLSGHVFHGGGGG